MQHGPGTENAFGGVAQAYGESVPIVVLPAGYPRQLTKVQPNFNAFLNYQHVTKSIEPVIAGRRRCPTRMRRAFTQVAQRAPAAGDGRDSRATSSRRSCRSRWTTAAHRACAPAPTRTRCPRSRAALVAAERPVIYAGQGVHYAQGLAAAAARWPSCSRRRSRPACRARARSPRTTRCRSARAARRSRSRCTTSCRTPTSIFGIGCSFTRDRLRRGHAGGQDASSTPRSTRPTSTRTCRVELRAGRRRRADAGRAARRGARPSARASRAAAARRSRGEITRVKRARGSAQWLPQAHLRRGAAHTLPRDLGSAAHGRRREHDHHPRRRAARATSSRRSGIDRAPLTYIGWGKTTQLGYGLGLAMGAKLARPTSSASTSGATPRSASPAWTSRPRCASASRSCRSCSTTSRWRSSCR